MQNGNQTLTTKLDEVLTNSRRVSSPQELSTQNDLKKFIDETKVLVE
jgi:hypothetical protein